MTIKKEKKSVKTVLFGIVPLLIPKLYFLLKTTKSLQTTWLDSVCF